MPYVTHFVFRPIMTMDIPSLGSVTTLEATGITENMKPNVDVCFGSLADITAATRHIN